MVSKGMDANARRYAQAIVDALELPSAVLGPGTEIWVANAAWLCEDAPPLAGSSLAQVGDIYNAALHELDDARSHAATQLVRALDVALHDADVRPRSITYRVRTPENKLRWWRTEVRPADIEPAAWSSPIETSPRSAARRRNCVARRLACAPS